MGKGKDSEDLLVTCLMVCSAAAFVCLAVILVLTLIGLGIAKIVIGSVWVYGTWGKLKSDSYIPCAGSNVTEGCTQETCNDTLLTFSFAMVTIDWVFIGMWIVIIGCKITRVCSKRSAK